MRKVFYSFCYDTDVMRVQQIRNIGAINDNKPVSPNQWETIKKSGDEAIKRWINENMEYRSCVIVLIGTETADSKWVNYEIKHAWNTGKALMGIYIHNLRDPNSGTCRKGRNPFSNFHVDGVDLANLVPCYDPNSWDAYGDIYDNIEDWVEYAIKYKRN